MDRDPFLGAPGIPVLNDSGSDIPPHGVVRLSSAGEDGVRTVAATTENSDPHVYVNGAGTLHNGDRGFVRFLPLGAVAYDPTDGEPALNETWGPKAGELLLRKGYLGFRCAGEPDGATAVFARVPEVDLDDEYPSVYYGSYDDGDGGATWSHDSTLNIGCETGTGNIIGDEVRYTTVLFVRRGRPTVSISLEVLEEDKILVATTCIEVVVPTGTTVECVDGDIVTTLETEWIRVISCKACP